MTLSNLNSTRYLTEYERFKSVKINDHLIFSSADRPEDVCGVNNESVPELLLDPPYGSFSFMVEGKVCISDLVLA